MGPALIAASIAAIAAVALSLPLRSPHDTLVNSATVAIATLIVGVGAGLVWHRLRESVDRLRSFVIAMAVALVVIAVALVALETQLERSFSFGLPLAVVAFVGTAALTVALDRVGALRPVWVPAVAVVAALAVGGALSGQGDAESGQLELPARAAASPTAAPASAPTTASTAAEPTAAAEQPSDQPRTAGDYDGITFVVSEGSEATFTVTEELANVPLPIQAVMRTTGLSGEVHLDGRPSTILLDLHSMSSDSEFRDRYVQRRMFAGYEVATFTVEAPSPLPDGFASGNEITAQATGTLDIRDVQVPITFEIQARDDGSALFILGRTTFTWDELSITKPTARSVVSLEDEVRVEIVLSAKPAAP